MSIPEIFRPNAYQQCSVTVFGIPGMEAHPINNDAAMLGGCSDHVPAGTHTEGIDTSAVCGMAGQFIRRRAKLGMTGKRTVLTAIN